METQQKKLVGAPNVVSQVSKSQSLAVSIDMDDAWTNPIEKEKSFLAEAFENILKEFEKKSYKPTLFLIGRDASDHNNLIQDAASMGFELGNHTFSHVYLDGMSYDEIDCEIRNTHEALKKYGPLVSFRAPGWATNGLVDNVLLELGYQIDASDVIGRPFILLKMVHQFMARKMTGIYGRYSNLIFNHNNLPKDNLEQLPLKTVLCFPFYHSVFKFLPVSICKLLIKFSQKNKIESYIFHARDFRSSNLNKTRQMILLLEEFYILKSVREIKNI